MAKIYMTPMSAHNPLCKANPVSPFTSDFVSAFHAGLERKPCVPSESLNIMQAANLNFLGQPVPENLFRSYPAQRYHHLVKYCRGLVKDGFVQIPTPQYRDIGRFQGHFNQLRSMKRAQATRKIPLAIREPFDDDAWNFTKVHPAEIFERLEIGGRSVSLLYNMFPFAPFHFLLVPERGRGLSQFLGTRDLLKLAWRFVMEACDPNIRLGYNALGGHASINHFHYQGFFVNDEFQVPIDRLIDQTQDKVESLREWPLKHTTVFKIEDEKDLDRVNSCLFQLHERAWISPNTLSYNLYIRPDSITVFPRKHHYAYDEGLVMSMAFASGVAFFEMAGTLIMSSLEHYENSHEYQILALIRDLSLREKPFSV